MSLPGSAQTVPGLARPATGPPLSTAAGQTTTPTQPSQTQAVPKLPAGGRHVRQLRQSLFGVATQDGVILVNKFRQNLREGLSLVAAIRDGAESRLRPVVMAALMASLGLLPAALSTGIGSETQKPLAIVVIGGLTTATLLSLLILPAVYEWIYSSRQERERRK